MFLNVIKIATNELKVRILMRNDLPNYETFAAAITEVPSAWAIRENPERQLRVALTSTLGGGRRGRSECALPAIAIREGAIEVEDIMVGYRPSVPSDVLHELVDEPVWGQESDEHRRLKLHARLLALAIDPSSELEPEACLGQMPSAKRVDLLAVAGSGALTAYECGSIDGRKICRLFDDGVARIIVLPFAGLNDPLFMRGWCFSLKGTSQIAPVSPDSVRTAWRTLQDNLAGFPVPTR